MPRLIDHAARHRAIGEAALRVLVRDGLSSLSVRKVAEEAGVATASLRRAFPSQDGLREWCFAFIRDRVEGRIGALAGQGPELVVALLAELLPLDDDRRAELAAQLHLATLTLTQPRLRPASAALTHEVRAVCQAAIHELERTGLLRDDLDPNEAVDTLHAALDGLALQSLLDPETYTPAATRSRLDLVLATITTSGWTSAAA